MSLHVEQLGRGPKGGAIPEPPAPYRVINYEDNKVSGEKGSRRWDSRLQSSLNIKSMFQTSTTPADDNPLLLPWPLPLVSSEATSTTRSPLSTGAAADDCDDEEVPIVRDGASEERGND